MLKAIRWRIRRQALALILALSVQPSMNGKAHDGGASQADSSTLYEAAKAHGNREAAAECSAKAGEALEAGDYDKAVSTPHERVISFFGALEETHPGCLIFFQRSEHLSAGGCVTEVLTRQRCVQERLYAKAERLAPGVYTEEAAKAAAQRAEYEAWAAEQVCPSLQYAALLDSNVGPQPPDRSAAAMALQEWAACYQHAGCAALLTPLAHTLQRAY